jgi:hypothetical protein
MFSAASVTKYQKINFALLVKYRNIKKLLSQYR